MKVEILSFKMNPRLHNLHNLSYIIYLDIYLDIYLLHIFFLQTIII